MPDRRTIVNQQEQYRYTLDQAIWSQHTINQDIKLFRNIKHGQEATIVCTPGECFWDYWNLSQIILIDPHKWYYKSQQEPRYDIARICELMAHYYGCTLTTNN
jgi:primosomal protein N'